MRIFFLFFIIISGCLPARAQYDTMNYNRKFSLAFNLGEGFMYDDGNNYLVINSMYRLRSGYFLTPRLFAFAGLDGFNSKSNLSGHRSTINIYALSPGIRYYFTKKNRLFLESGIQYGRLLINESSREKYSFLQAGVGGGIHFLLHQGVSGGRFALEFVFRSNFEIMPKAKTDADIFLQSLGTSFGINLLFPVAPFSWPVVNTPALPLQSIHILKLNYPSKIAYSFELALRNTHAINFELTAHQFLGLLSTDRFFAPGLKVEYRNYYGYFKRHKRGQVTINNSSDFIAFTTSYTWLYSSTVETDFRQLGFSPRWGIRRAIGRKFIFEATIGGSIVIENNRKLQILPHGETLFGYVF